MNKIVAFATIAVFLGAGIWCLTQARNIQKRAIAAGNELKFNPFRNYIRSKSYLVVTRIIGGACIVIAILLAFVLIRY